MSDFMKIYLTNGETMYIRKSAVTVVENIGEYGTTAALIGDRELNIDESFKSFMERLEEDN